MSRRIVSHPAPRSARRGGHASDRADTAFVISAVAARTCRLVRRTLVGSDLGTARQRPPAIAASRAAARLAAASGR